MHDFCQITVDPLLKGHLNRSTFFCKKHFKMSFMIEVALKPVYTERQRQCTSTL